MCNLLLLHSKKEGRRDAWRGHHDGTETGQVVLATGAENPNPGIGVMEYQVKVVKAAFIVYKLRG